MEDGGHYSAHIEGRTWAYIWNRGLADTFGPKRRETTGGSRKCHKKVYNCCSPSDIVKVVITKKTKDIGVKTFGIHTNLLFMSD
jgi:hypothetical protein